MSNISDATKIIKNRVGDEAPKLAVVLGSGLGALTERLSDATTIQFGDLPGFPASGVSGHQGSLIIGTLGGTCTAVISGRVHYYEHGDPNGMMTPLSALAEIGCTTLALSNAAGSTREDMPPGSLMAITDHLNWSGLNPLIGTDGDRRFVDMSQAYDRDLAEQFRTVATGLNTTLHEGVYAWYSGPSFETPAEINALRMLGANAVGMSTVPEVILARYLDLRVAGVSVIANFAAGMDGAMIGHGHTKSEADKAQTRFCDLFEGFASSLKNEGSK
jgi:purine-nucleoside phosphorylase